MESFLNWGAIGTVFSIFSWVCGVVVFCVIKFNDLSHIDKRLGEMEKKQDTMNEKINNISVDLAYLSGRAKSKLEE